MRFNNEDYLKAFSREERTAAAEKTIVKDEPGDVFDEQKETPAGDPEVKDPEPADPESVGGEGSGNE